MTAADQPTTEPSEVRYAVARALACVGADRSYTGPRFDGASDDDPAKDYWLRRADAALAVLAPAPQPAADTETEGVRHFAPWGTCRASCGVTVPPGEAPESSGFTYRRRDTTCPDCRAHFTNPADTETEVQWGLVHPSGNFMRASCEGTARLWLGYFGGTLVTYKEEA